jgi:hypothetical protein
LPADLGLKVCLKTLRVHCSINGDWIEPSSVRVTKTSEAYAPLRYLSPFTTC